MAHAFATDDGVAFAEPGWDRLPAADACRLHAIVGRVRPAGAGWAIGMADGEEIRLVPLDDAKLRRLQLEDWSPGDPDLCLLLIRQSVAPSAREAVPIWVRPAAGARPEAGLRREQAR